MGVQTSAPPCAESYFYVAQRGCAGETKEQVCVMAASLAPASQTST